jgi:streptogramin lyase
MNDDLQTERLVRDWLDATPYPRPQDHVIDAVLDALPATQQDAADGRTAALGRLRRAGLAAAAAVAAVALAGLALVLVIRPAPTVLPGASPSPDASPSIASPAASLGPSLPPGVTSIDMGLDTWSLAIDDASVWVQIGETGTGRIDRKSNRDTGIRVPEVPQMQFQDGQLWALDVGTGIIRVDPLTGDVLQTIPGVSGFYIAVDGLTAWVSDVGHTVDRIDLATGEVVASIDVPAGPKEMVVFDDDLWVVCDQGGVVARIDGTTNAIAATIDAGFRPGNLAGGEGAVWVWNHDQQLLRVDPATNTVVATIDGIAETLGAGVTVGGGFVWAAVPTGIGRIDPATNEIVDVIPLGPGGYVDLAWFDGELWASSTDRNLVYRMETTR